MTEVNRSVLVGFTPERMFALVDAVEDYPKFLPWCGGATVIHRDEGITRAAILINYHGIKHSFTTENAKTAPSEMSIRLVEGPFRRLDGGWRFTGLAGRAQLKEAYVIVSNGELFLTGCHVSPLPSASTHLTPDPTRTRKLLLHAAEISRLIGSVERAGYALVPLDLHYKGGRIKLEIGLARGKRQYDKRQAEKEKDWRREQQRLLRIKH